MKLLNKKHLFIFFLALTLASLPSCFQQQQSTAKTETPSTEFKLALPIDCKLGQDCHILAYTDRDPSTNYTDFNCGRQTYEGHDGTDFGIADEQAMNQGVPVKAAAAGKVFRVRDGVEDKRIENPEQAEAISDIGCGNAVVIDHPNGWRTYYCHLRKGSVAVQSGTEVEKGTVLGMVGVSGLASFPHVHLGVVHQGKTLDPFVGVEDAKGCKVKRTPLWETNVDYVGTGLIKAGFTTEKPTLNAIWKGSLPSTVNTQSPALIFWVHPFGVLAGDKEKFKLISPDNSTEIEHENDIKSPNRINWVSFIGKRNTPEKPLRTGTWRAEYQLLRDGKTLIDINKEIVVNP